MSNSTVATASSPALKPAAELTRASGFRFPNESAEYRRAREALLVEEIELRRHIERVAEQRRALPPGGEVKKQYAFTGEGGRASFADLFGDKNTLVVYSYMFGPQRERPCPMCTSLLSAWDGEVPDIRQRVALAVVARSPIERLVAFKHERGWRYLPLYQDISSEFSRDYYGMTENGGDDAGIQCVHAEGRYDPAFLGRRDEWCVRGSRSGSAWRARSDAALDHPRRDARGARDRLVPEAGLLERNRQRFVLQMCRQQPRISYQNGTAQQPPALNPHLTKNRLNDAPRLCEMVHRNFGGPPRAGRRSNVFEEPASSNGGCGGIKVERVWMRGG
jgi:predicted dithiol-disulfide oxidoreductase (DUF899 family)